jgi:hypothetical protein
MGGAVVAAARLLWARRCGSFSKTSCTWRLYEEQARSAGRDPSAIQKPKVK